MKKLLLLLCNLIPLLVLTQSTYYVSTDGNDANNGTSPLTPWQTVAKVNTHLRNSFKPGDVILFKRGNIFTTSTAIRITKSGISLGAYGTGNLPEITGFNTVSSWTASSGNRVYSAVVATSKPTTYPSSTNLEIAPINMVSINGVPQILGRTPNVTDTNGGYRNYLAVVASGVVDTTKLKLQVPFLPAGNPQTGFREVAFRTSEWNVYRAKINGLNLADTTLSFSRFFHINNGSKNAIDVVDMTKGHWGYYFQNDSTYLDQFGEWHYDYPTQRLRVFFGANSPSSYIVKIATADTLLFMGNSLTNINITDLKFTGSNLYAILGAAVSANIQSCEFDQIGAQAIGIYRPYNTLIRNNTISNCMQAGIYTRVATSDTIYTNLKINNNKFKNIGLQPGMGAMNQGTTDFAAISLATFRNTQVDSNYISRIGGDGINFQGSDITIGYNRIDSFCSVLQDHAAIYTYWDPSITSENRFTNRRIHHNFIYNALSSPGGTPLKRTFSNLGTWKRNQRVNGIYGDGTSNNLLVDNNVIWNIKRVGYYFNAPTNVQILNNFYLADTSTTRVNSFATEDDLSNRGISIRDRNTTDTASNVTIKRNTIYLFNTTIANKYQATYGFDQIAAPRPGIPANATGVRQWVRNIGTIDSNYINAVTTFAIKCTASTYFDSLTLSRFRTDCSKDLKSTVLSDVSKNRIAFHPNPTASPITVYLNAQYRNVQGVIQQRNITVPAYSYYFGTYAAPLSTTTTNKNQ